MSNILQTEFGVQAVLDVLSKVGFSSAHWREFGRRLKPDLDLNGIEDDHPRNSKRCLEEVIRRWESDGDDQSWETLADAVSKCKEGGGKNMAEKIRKVVLADSQLVSVITISSNPASPSNNKRSTQKGGGQNQGMELALSPPTSPSLGEAPEARAFRESFDKLTKAITHSEGLAPKLYSEGLISQQARDEVFLPVVESKKTSELLAAVEKGLNPERMDKFVIVLSGIPPLQEISSELNQRVKELRSEQGQKQALSPPASPTTSRPATARRQKYRKCHSDSFTPLEVLFVYLVCDLIDILEREQVLLRMKTAMDYLPWREKPKFKKILSDSYKKATSVKEFIDALHPTCLDCELLSIAVKATRCMEAIDRLDEYLELKESESIPIPESGAGGDEATEGVANGNADNMTAGAVIRRDGLTGRQYEQTTSWLSYVWEIPRAAFRFFWSKKGSFILRWKIHSSLEPHIRSMPITGEALKKFAEFQVSQITLGDSYKLEIPSLPQEAEEAEYSFKVLSSAMWAGNDHMMELLIRGGASPDKQNEEGISLLMEACCGGHLHIVNTLLKNGATVDLKDQEGSTAVMVAAVQGHASVVERLINAGGNPNLQTKDGWSALYSACRRKHMEVVQVLLHMGADPNIQTDDGWTALMDSCRSENSEIVAELLKAGADPNTPNHENRTALMTAARNGRLNSVVKLLEYKANPDLQDDSGWSALMDAVWQSHEEVALKMLEAGATPDIQDKEGTNALFLAIYRQLPRIVKAVMARSLNVNLQDMVGETPLMYACKMKDLDSVKMLLEKNANPNIVSNSKETALLFATQRKEVGITEELLEARTQLLSSKEGSGQLVECLLQYGADPNLVV